jgi:class 3 adenylate cyclase
MGSLRARDRLLLLVLLPIWLVCFALFVGERWSGRPTRPTLLVTSGAAGGYPEVVRYRPGLARPTDALRAGDRLLRIGSRAAAGLSAVGVLAESLAQADPAGLFEVEYERDGVRRSERIALLPEEWPWRTTASTLAFAGIAVLLILRAPRSRTAQAFLPASLVWSLSWIEFQGALPLQTWAYVAVRTVTGCLWAPLMLRAALHFPEELAPPSGRAPRWIWAFSLLGLTWTSMWFGFPLPIEVGTRLNPALGALVIVVVLAVLTRNYLRAGPAGRRQVKWVLLGIYLGTLPVLAAVVAAAVDPDLVWLWSISLSALVAIPLSIFFAITRANLFDIDRVISTTATYSLLLTAALAGGLAALPRLAEALSARTELEASSVQVALGVGLAPLVVVIGRSVRPRLDRFFFAERYALQSGLDALARRLAAAPDPESLVEAAGEGLDVLVRPACCVFYGRAGSLFVPVFVRGAQLAPTFPADGPLLRALAERGAPVDLERRGALAALAPGAEERGALGSLGASLLIPVGEGARLSAFVALGPKRSGDVYTATDLAMLGATAASMAGSVMRFDEKEVLREARAVQERLRRYVPSALASSLARGAGAPSGEREVTVLFADLRSYTALSQGLPADQVFASVSRYAAIVSNAVAGRGGTVVEFAGDGLMAVFGAPDPLPDKERAAVLAALEIAREVASLSLFPGAPRSQSPPVGIGVATGEAYVGTIHAVDRDLWSAIGNTTNLAARLQSLTRDLDAWIALDDVTWRRAGDPCRHFTHHPQLPLRGLRTPHDVHTLEQV